MTHINNSNVNYAHLIQYFIMIHRHKVDIRAGRSDTSVGSSDTLTLSAVECRRSKVSHVDVSEVLF